MAFGNIGTLACQNLQVALFSYFGKNIPELRTMGSISLVKWLLSPQNTANFQRINVESIPGKKRGVAFLLEDPFCFEIAKIADVDCDTTRAYRDPGTNEIVFDLGDDPFRAVNTAGDTPEKLRFKLDDLMKYCQRGDMAWMQNKIAKYLMAFERSLDKRLITALSPFIHSDWQKELPLFAINNSTGGAVLNPEGTWAMNQLYSDVGLDGNYGVIGGAIVSKMEQFKAWQCCNNAGVDMSKKDASTAWAFYDRNYDSMIGTKSMWMLAPGAVQLVTWNRNRGEKKMEVTDLYTHGTMTMPGTGLQVDFEWNFDYKCKVWEFEAFLHAELAVVPAGGCGTEVENANGLIQVTDCSIAPVIPACPVGGV